MTAKGLATADQPAAAGRDTPLPGARLALIMLLSINLFNYIDRYILAAVEPNIRGRTVAARAVVRGAARHDPVAQLWLLTSRYLRPVGPDHLRAAMVGENGVTLRSVRGGARRVVHGRPLQLWIRVSPPRRRFLTIAEQLPRPYHRHRPRPPPVWAPPGTGR